MTRFATGLLISTFVSASARQMIPLPMLEQLEDGPMPIGFPAFPLSDSSSEDAEDALYNSSFFQNIFDIFSMLGSQVNNTEPEVKFDFSGDFCLISVGGIEGFDPKSENLRVRVRPDTEEEGAIVTIIYTTKSGGDDSGDDKKPSPRLRGGVQFVSESTHVVQLPKQCCAQSPDESKFMSSNDGWLLIKIPKKKQTIDVVKPVGELKPVKPEEDASVSEPKPTLSVVHERATPEGLVAEVVNPDGTVEEELFEKPEEVLPQAHIVRQLDEWDMRREEF